MGISDFVRLTSLLSRLSRPPSRGGPPAGVEEQYDLSAPSGGCRYDLYLPQGAVRAAVVAVHGVTPHGRQESRLVHFARCLAQTGAACAVPTLEGMTACQLNPHDVHGLGQVALAVAHRTGHKSSIIGFSFGGSYALVAAARPAVAEQVRFVLAMGAYASMVELQDRFAELPAQLPDDPQALDDRIYLHLVFALRHKQALGLEPGTVEQLERLFPRFCHDASPLEKRQVFDQLLEPLDLLARCDPLRDREAEAALSPAGNLSGLRAAVSLVHDRNDSMLPASQAEALYAELRRQPDPGRHHLLITSLLSHVELTSVLKLGEVRRLFGVLGPIFGS